MTFFNEPEVQIFAPSASSDPGYGNTHNLITAEALGTEDWPIAAVNLSLQLFFTVRDEKRKTN